MKHKWKNEGIEYKFCVKCGILKGLAFKKRDKYNTKTRKYKSRMIVKHPCTVSDKAFNKQYVHDFGKRVTCNKCGRHKRDYFHKKVWNGDVLYVKAYSNVTPSVSTMVKVPCTMTDDEFLVKNIIE